MRVRAIVVVAAAGAVWLAGTPTRADEMHVSTRLPWVPPEVLSPVVVPDDPSSGVTVRIDPGDNDRPDPVPQLIVTIRTPNP